MRRFLNRGFVLALWMAVAACGTDAEPTTPGAAIKLAVNDVGIATDEDTPVTVALDVTSSVPLDKLTITWTEPLDGNLVQDSDPLTLTYTPNPDSNGDDVVTYTVTYGKTTKSAEINIRIKPINDAPSVLMAAIEPATPRTLDTLTVTPTGWNDVDGDEEDYRFAWFVNGSEVAGATTALLVGSHFQKTDQVYAVVTPVDAKDEGLPVQSNSVTVMNTAPVAFGAAATIPEDGSDAGTLTATDADSDGLIFALATQAASGTAVVQLDGSYTYTPDLDYNGVDSFTFTAGDGEGNSIAAEVMITVTAVNDAPVAADESYQTDEDVVLVVAAPGVLANDTDVDGDSLSAVVVTGPTLGNLVLDADGSFTYTPDADFNGADTFIYRATDGSLSDYATVTITVNSVNDAPTASAESVVIYANQALQLSLSGLAGDIDGDNLTFVAVTAPTHAASFNLAGDGTLEYTPAAGYVGGDSLGFRVFDGTEFSNTVAVSITVEEWDPVFSMAPVSGPTGRTLLLTGTPFFNAGTATVGGVAADVAQWTPSSVAVTVPAGLAAGDHDVILYASGAASTPRTYRVMPWLDGVNVAWASPGDTITVTGSGLGAAGTAYIDGNAVATASWSANSVAIVVPGALAGGYYNVFLVESGSGLESNRVGVAITGSDVWLSDPVPAARESAAAVWTGNELIVWGGQLWQAINDGARYNPTTDTWQTMSSTGAPTARTKAVAVWSGKEMLVFGGMNNGYPTDHAAYDPAANAWRTLSTANAPAARIGHAAVWSGAEMLVWGGNSWTGGRINDGAKYDPLTNTWTAMSQTNAPSSRYQHSFVWAGDAMFIYGGDIQGQTTDTGALYDPVADSWTTISTVGAPAKRYGAVAVYTGEEVLVWGGSDPWGIPSYKNDGGRYNLKLGSWSPVTTAGAPTARTEWGTVWTGDRMIIWGGYSSVSLDTGAEYDPSTDTWTEIGMTGVPISALAPVAAWTGQEMIVWGGKSWFGTPNGGRYNPAARSWSRISAGSQANRPSPRSAVGIGWTGSHLIYWGGMDSPQWHSDGHKYDPATDTWTPIASSPGPRANSDVAWTGSKMIFFYGNNRTIDVYDPAMNSWTSGPYGPTADNRNYSSAVWTGSAFVVWGGRASSGANLNTGGIYDVALNSWTPTSVTDAPAARYGQAATTINGKLFVWGGMGAAWYQDGGIYDPVADAWVPVTSASAPAARGYSTAVAIDGKVYVWGGKFGASTYHGDGAAYDPVADTWATIASAQAPSGRTDHLAIRYGGKMLIWGGSVSSNSVTNTGAIYDSTTDTWTPMTQVNAPAFLVQPRGFVNGNEILLGFMAYTSGISRYLP